jgi:hypothetical protein
MPPTKISVGLVFGGGEKDAEAFRQLLNGDGFDVDLIAFAAVPKADLKKYGLIVIGAEAWDEAWGELATVIDRAGKPVLALGECGYSFLGQTGLKLGIGSPHGWHGEDTGVRPVDAAKSPVWIGAGVSTENAVTLYKRSGHVGIHLPKPEGGIVLLGREAVDADHYAIVGQGDRVLWGFTGSPLEMTEAGRKVFVATCRYTASLTRPAKNEK